MAVLKDYKCEKHGYFESFEAKCPMKNCEEEVFVVFLQAPGLISDSTKSNDKNIKQLAIDFGMTDVKSTREGENQAGYLTRNNTTPTAPEQRPGSGVIWGGAGSMNLQAALGGQVARSVRGENVGLNPKAAGITAGPAVTQNYTGKI